MGKHIDIALLSNLFLIFSSFNVNNVKYQVTVSRNNCPQRNITVVTIGDNNTKFPNVVREKKKKFDMPLISILHNKEGENTDITKCAIFG